MEIHRWVQGLLRPGLLGVASSGDGRLGFRVPGGPSLVVTGLGSSPALAFKVCGLAFWGC